MNYVISYEAAQTPTQLPTITLKLGDYHWKVHEYILTHKSEFFRKAISGRFQEASSREILLHDDDPWIIARIIQFIYTGTWEVDHQEGLLKNKSYPGFSFARITQHKTGLDKYQNDKSKDSNRSWSDIYVMTLNTADKYMMEYLLWNLTLSATIERCIRKDGRTEFLDKVFYKITRERMDQQKQFKAGLLNYFADFPEMMEHPEIQNWCHNDPQLGISVINACVQEMKELKKLVKDLQDGRVGKKMVKHAYST